MGGGRMGEAAAGGTREKVCITKTYQDFFDALLLCQDKLSRNSFTCWKLMTSENLSDNLEIAKPRSYNFKMHKHIGGHIFRIHKSSDREALRMPARSGLFNFEMLKY